MNSRNQNTIDTVACLVLIVMVLAAGIFGLGYWRYSQIRAVQLERVQAMKQAAEEARRAEEAIAKEQAKKVEASRETP